MERFRGDNNARAISSVDTATPEVGGRETVDAGFSAIVVTSDGVFDPRYIGEMNGGLLFLYTEDTDSLLS